MEGGGWAQRSRPPDPSFLHGPGQGQQHHTAHTSPFGVWPLKSRSSVLGLTWSGQRGRRDWRSEAVEVFLYTRNCMEICRGQCQGQTKQRGLTWGPEALSGAPFSSPPLAAPRGRGLQLQPLPRGSQALPPLGSSLHSAGLDRPISLLFPGTSSLPCLTSPSGQLKWRLRKLWLTSKPRQPLVTHPAGLRSAHSTAATVRQRCVSTRVLTASPTELQASWGKGPSALAPN